MKVRISVTQEDIDNGKPNDSYLCPIGRACKRAGLAEDEFVAVIDELRLPGVAQGFVTAFDDHFAFGSEFPERLEAYAAYVRPFEFDIEPDMPEIDYP